MRLLIRYPCKDLLVESEITYKIILADLIFWSRSFLTTNLKNKLKLWNRICETKGFVKSNFICIK